MKPHREIILVGEPQRNFALQHIAKLTIDPKRPFAVTIAPYVKKRSLSQLRLLWKRHNEVAEAVADVTGYSPEDIHDFCKRKWLTPRIVEIGGEIIERYSTKDLSAKEMSEFMEKIVAWAGSEFGLILTSPDDLGREL